MSKIEIDEDELNATREQAAECLPWKNEARRLAEALYHVRPNHPLLLGGIWQPMVDEFERSDAEGTGFEPDRDAARIITDLARHD